MKKVLLAIVLFTIAMVAIPRVTYAYPDIHFYISITDNCHPQPYTGYYCIQVWIYHNTDVVCSWQDCNYTSSSTQVNYYGCDFIQEDQRHYRIVAKLWRRDDSGCSDTQYTGLLFPGDLNNNPQTLNFVLN